MVAAAECSLNSPHSFLKGTVRQGGMSPAGLPRSGRPVLTASRQTHASALPLWAVQKPVKSVPDCMEVQAQWSIHPSVGDLLSAGQIEQPQRAYTQPCV